MAKDVFYTELADVAAPTHSLLVVWDMQNALVNRAFNKQELLASVGALIAAARKAQVPIVYTKITPLPFKFQSPAAVAMQMRRMGVKDVKQLRSLFADDPKLSEIADTITPAPDDLVINKNTASIFIGTNFDYIARYGGIETVIFTGISTEYGIESSARDAMNRGYYVVVVSDCVSSSNKEGHERSLASLRGLCHVVPRDDVVKAWEADAP